MLNDARASDGLAHGLSEARATFGPCSTPLVKAFTGAAAGLSASLLGSA